MSRLEQRNLVILVAVIVGLVVGVGVFANYRGILQAQSNQQDQPKIGCSSGGMACGGAEATTFGLTSGEAGGSCGAEKTAGCGDNCQDCPDCPHKKASGCCGAPKAEGCRAAETDGTI